MRIRASMRHESSLSFNPTQIPFSTILLMMNLNAETKTENIDYSLVYLCLTRNKTP